VAPKLRRIHANDRGSEIPSRRTAAGRTRRRDAKNHEVTAMKIRLATPSAAPHVAVSGATKLRPEREDRDGALMFNVLTRLPTRFTSHTVTPSPDRSATSNTDLSRMCLPRQESR